MLLLIKLCLSSELNGDSVSNYLTSFEVCLFFIFEVISHFGFQIGIAYYDFSLRIVAGCGILKMNLKHFDCEKSPKLSIAVLLNLYTQIFGATNVRRYELMLFKYNIE